MNLQKLKITRKSGEERFFDSERELPFDLLSFWQWSSSDLVNNTLRGVLAEYIVAKAVGAKIKVRTAWDSYDLITPSGIKIEVKSSAFLQSWKQDKLSSITFGIQPTYAWDDNTNTSSTELRRQADVYVFALLWSLTIVHCALSKSFIRSA